MRLQAANTHSSLYRIFTYFLVFAILIQPTRQLGLALSNPLQIQDGAQRQSSQTTGVKTQASEPQRSGSGSPQPEKKADSYVERNQAQKKGAEGALQSCKTSDASLGPISNKSAADRWGIMTVAQPKIWEYERVNSLLDGLLRDVEGVSLADLTGLNPNSQNAAALKFIQSALEVGVQYDQANAVNSANTLQNFQIQHQSDVQKLNQYNSYLNDLAQQRSLLTQQLFTANATVVRLQSRQDAGAAMSAEEIAQLAEAKSQATALQSQLTNVNSLISGAGAAPSLTAPPTVQGTNVQAPLSGAPASSLSSFGDIIKSLPQGVQNNLSSALQSPSYPATKQLQNFITLLHERLAQEISVLQDDIVRDPNNLAYLVQFDVGLYPSDKTKNHMARVAFDLSCPGCKVYSLYPGESSYNVANYQGSSRRKTFWGNAATLIGLGITAAYRHQTDTLQGSLVQSVYVSGFQEGGADHPDDAQSVGQQFGWYYNAAPFDEYITPGIRSTFALITVPRAQVQQFGRSGACLPLQVEMDWAKRDNPMYQKSHWYAPKDHLAGSLPTLLKESLSVKLPGSEYIPILPRVVERERDRLHVVRMEYNTIQIPGLSSSSNPAAQAMPSTAQLSPGATAGAPTAPASVPVQVPDPFTGCPRGQCAAILLSLDVPIDPNLVISVKGRPLDRIRDWRGRATSILPPVQSGSDIPAAQSTPPITTPKVVPPPSLLEADQLQPNTWFAINSHDLILNVSRDLAGDASFPTIQISDPAKRTMLIPDDLRQDVTEIIQNGFNLNRLNSVQMVNRYAAVRLRKTRDWKNESSGEEALPLMSGPYPYSTFLPLFEVQPAFKKFYAYLGEAGDLLIGFLGDPEGGTIDFDSYAPWVESRAQVIIEDRNLPFAWSLSCTGQGSQLVCTLPTEQIQKAYSSLFLECRDEGDCLALDQSADVVQRALAKRGKPNADVLNEKDPDKRVKHFGKGIKDLRLYWPNLQVWVHQYDPFGKNAVASFEPAPLGLFPLWDFRAGEHLFRPWHFSSASGDGVTVEECNFFETEHIENFEVRLLTDPTTRPKPLEFIPGEDGCASARLPSYVLMRGNAVLRVGFKNDSDVHWITAIPSAQLRPQLRRPRIQVVRGETAPFRVKSWVVDIPVPRASCHDVLDHAKELDNAGIKRTWMDGDEPMSGENCNRLEASKPGNPGQWWRDSNLEETLLRLEVPKSAFRSLLPSEIHLVRKGTANNPGEVQLATLPDLRKLLLPDKLTLVAMGKNQFGLRGKNATALDAVTLQSGNKGYTYKVVANADFAPVALSSAALVLATPDATKQAPPKKEAKPVAPKPAVAPAIFRPSDFAQLVLVSQTPTPQYGSTAQDGKATGTTGKDASGQDKKTPPKKPSEPKKASGQPQPTADSGIPAPGTYTVIPLFLTDTGLKDWSTLAPIDVTDAQGNGLVFIQPDTPSETKPTTAQPSTKTEIIEKKTTTTTNTGQKSQ